MPDPHDKLFKYAFGQPGNAAAYFARTLPDELVARLDLQRAEVQSGSYVDEALGERHSDLLYTVPWRDAAESGAEPALLYVLFEHQSEPDRLMAFRLLRYMVRIWERWLQDHRAAASLPVILPVVLYHGEQRWRAAVAFEELLEVEPAAWAALEGFVPGFSFLLQDLSDYPDAELRARALGRLALLMLKHARDEGLERRLPEWAETFREVLAEPDGLRALRVVVEYLLQAPGGGRPEDLRRFLSEHVSPEVEDVPMSVAQELREEGRQEGLEQGRRGTLLRLIELKLGAPSQETRARVEAASESEVERLLERILTADSAEELFGE